MAATVNVRGLELDLDDERECRLDGEYLQTVDEEDRAAYLQDRTKLREARVAQDRRDAAKRAVLSATPSMATLGIVKRRPPNPHAGLAPSSSVTSSTPSITASTVSRHSEPVDEEEPVIVPTTTLTTQTDTPSATQTVAPARDWKRPWKALRTRQSTHRCGRSLQPFACTA